MSVYKRDMFWGLLAPKPLGRGMIPLHPQWPAGALRQPAGGKAFRPVAGSRRRQGMASNGYDPDGAGDAAKTSCK